MVDLFSGTGNCTHVWGTVFYEMLTEQAGPFLYEGLDANASSDPVEIVILSRETYRELIGIGTREASNV